MMWPQFEIMAQVTVGRILNSLPEGLVIALFAWVMLRCLPRQNSGTRFAVWLIALISVTALPLIDAGAGVNKHSVLSSVATRPLITLPGHWGLLLFAAWLLMASIALLRLAIGLYRLHSLRKRCVAVDQAGLDPTIRKTLAEFGAARSVTLATSDQMNVPAAIGFFRPMIVIPSWTLQELPPDELNIVLLHELAHLRRWDDWTNLLQKIVRAAFLFHPAVWWIENRLSLEREMACDDQVLAATSDPRAYAECLIQLLEKSGARRGLAMAQALVNRAREATLRLARILDASRPQSKYVWKPALGLVGAFSMVCILTAPHAQLVAIDKTGNASAIYARAVPRPPRTQSEFPRVAATPVASRMPLPASPKKIHKQTSAAKPESMIARSQERPHAFSPVQVVEARWTNDIAGTENVRVDTETAEASPRVLPASETFFIVRTAQQVGPNAWVWSVGVWRVTVVNAVQQRVEIPPAASKT